MENHEELLQNPEDLLLRRDSVLLQLTQVRQELVKCKEQTTGFIALVDLHVKEVELLNDLARVKSEIRLLS